MKENDNEKRIAILVVFALPCSGFSARWIRLEMDRCGGILI